MVFSSQTFLFFFLPLAGLCVLIRSKPVQNAMLLIASLIFYAWGEPKMVVLMVLVTLVAYGSGFAIVHFEARPRAKKAALIAAIVVILGNLVVFKYLNFLCRTFSFLGLTDPGIALPIGISFYTFQILSYVIDLYRGKIALQRNFFYLLMYVSFFPQLIADPIVRYETVEQEIRERQVTMDDLAQGFRRFVVGLAKKLLLANQVAQVATIVYSGNPANYGSLMYWLAAIAYTLQIYFDFSGYSDMAIGLGRMFGFHFLENFNYPYISLSVTEFWRRWHISLSTWFRDYVYIPLGGNRVSRGKWVRNILVVWGLTGLWHGADWNFLLWGLYYAADRKALAGQVSRASAEGAALAAVHDHRVHRLGDVQPHGLCADALRARADVQLHARGALAVARSGCEHRPAAAVDAARARILHTRLPARAPWRELRRRDRAQRRVPGAAGRVHRLFRERDVQSVHLFPLLRRFRYV